MTLRPNFIHFVIPFVYRLNAFVRKLMHASVKEDREPCTNTSAESKSMATTLQTRALGVSTLMVVVSTPLHCGGEHTIAWWW